MAERLLTSVVVACGGTGGHVYPAIAIARELLGRHPHLRLSFIGRPDSYESRVLAAEGFEMDALRIGRLVGQGMPARARTLAQLPFAVLRAFRLLSRRRPSVILGTGGFVSGPALLAAALRRTPIVVQEQNAIPGLTNRVVSALASRVALAHPRPGAEPPKHRVTGNPVRPGFGDVPRMPRIPPFGVLVMGGSQGARRLNVLAVAAAGALAPLGAALRFTIQCGPAWEEETRRLAQEAGASVEIAPYLDDVPARLGAASLVICRAGASTIAEICAAGRASILVPLPTAAADHQTGNARAMAQAGAAEWAPEQEMTGPLLADRIRALLDDPARLHAMAGAARGLARPRAAADVADLCEEVAR